MSTAKSIVKTREEWLELAIDMFRPMFDAAGAKLPKKIHVSVGFAYGAKRENAKILGQTWRKEASDDGVCQVFISPEMDQAYDVLETLIHELIHVVDNCDSGHKGEFTVLATKLGLTAPFTLTPASAATEAELWVMATELGHYPHSQLHTRIRNAPTVVVGPNGAEVPTTVKWTSGPGKQTTRMVKCDCQECGYTVRTTRRWLNASGAPICPKDMIRMTVHD